MTPVPDYLDPYVSFEDAAEWMLAAGYRLSQLEWLQRVVVDVATVIATPEDADGRG